MTFDKLLKGWDWKPIRNCPGRYILQNSRCDMGVAELLGEDVEPREHRVETTVDTVLVVKFDDGGLISYKRPDGSVLHTLNTPEGFGRKLLQLGIDSP